MKRSVFQTSLASFLALGLLFATSDAESLVPPVTSEIGNTRCSVRKDTSGWWFVSPDGQPFFSLGICMFNQGLEKKDYSAEKPGYAAWRHYETPEAWAGASLARLKEWRFTTVGGWSDYRTLALSNEHDLWITPVLHIGSRSGAPWFDMWDKNVVATIEKVAEETIVPLRDDPRVMGYYSDNELGWWNAIHWKMTLEQPPTSGQRQRLVRLVRDTYKSDWDALLKDFEPVNAESWETLQHGGMLWLRPNSNGILTMRRFLALAADRYYQLMRDTIRKFDPAALYLGDRYQSFYYPDVPIASRPYVDVVSTNFNVSWNDGTFIRSFLDTLHAITDKPIVVSEFYMAAEENRSGNKNTVGGFPEVATQDERGAALANTIRGLARLPYVVGADWFQYYDEPPHGRKLDGEDYNFGLVDIHDEPYREVIEVFASTDLNKLRLASATTRPTTTNSPTAVKRTRTVIPPAPADPFADFRFMTALKNWDRQRGHIPPTTKHALGDLYLCWSPTALYLAAYVLDIVEPDYYRDGVIPDADRATWTIRVNGQPPISAITGAGKELMLSDPNIRAEALSGTYHDVRCITVIELPAARFGRDELEPGHEIELESSYATHGRANRIEWNGKFVLSE